MSERINPTTIQILQVIEQFLEKRDITIPDPNRMGEADEARLFGDAYRELETSIDRIIKERNKSLLKHRAKLIREREELPETLAALAESMEGQIDLINELLKETNT